MCYALHLITQFELITRHLTNTNHHFRINSCEQDFLETSLLTILPNPHQLNRECGKAFLIWLFLAIFGLQDPKNTYLHLFQIAQNINTKYVLVHVLVKAHSFSQIIQYMICTVFPYS